MPCLNLQWFDFRLRHPWLPPFLAATERVLDQRLQRRRPQCAIDRETLPSNPSTPSSCFAVSETGLETEVAMTNPSTPPQRASIAVPVLESPVLRDLCRPVIDVETSEEESRRQAVAATQIDSPSATETEEVDSKSCRDHSESWPRMFGAIGSPCSVISRTAS